MADSTSALYQRTLACPACGTKTPQREIKTGMYAEEERESDQHVARYRWLKPDVPPVHPPYYALHHCPQCGFTDFAEDFAEPTKSRENRVRLLAPKLKTELQRRGSPVATLHQGLGTGPVDFPAALRRHLLAIAIQELLPDERRDHLKLGRLYLRTAWLYREQGETAPPSLQESEGLAALEQYAAALRALVAAFERVRALYAVAPATSTLDVVHGHVQALARASIDLAARLVAPTSPPTGLGFLPVLRGAWPGVPTMESAALEAAVQAFERVYETGEGDTLALLKLMSDLNYRVGRFARVLEYAAAISKTAYEERTIVQRQLGDRTLTGEQRTKLTARATRAQAMLELAADLRRQAAQCEAAAPPA